MQEAWERGRANLIAKNAQRLQKFIRKKNPNLTALIFWLKAQAGWREADKTPAQQSIGQVNVVINAPVPPGLVQQPTGREIVAPDNQVQEGEVVGCLSESSRGAKKEDDPPALPARQRWDMETPGSNESDPTSRETEG